MCFVLMVQCLVHRYNYNSLALVQWDLASVTKYYLRWVTLFVTSATLLCCALPILLVTLGFGVVVASLNYNILGLVMLLLFLTGGAKVGGALP